jgi:adenosylhomocysteine nucleosidase
MELTPLAKRLGLRKDTVAGVPMRTGDLDGRPVVALATGMGTELATASTERLLDAVTPAHLVVFGITGAVDDDIEIGALVRPEVVIFSETGAEHRPVPLGDDPVHGTMWTTNVMTPAAELPALVERGVVSLDMETAAIAASCERRGVPWSVVRAISDRATDDTIDDEVFRLAHQDGRPNPRAIARFAGRHPLKLLRLAAMGAGARRATIAAAEAAIAGARTLPR